MTDTRQTFRQGSTQKLQAYPCDLTSPDDAAATYHRATKSFDSRAPDYIFTCAGGCVPTLFADMDVAKHWECMEWNFKTALCTIHDGIKGMKNEEPRKGEKSKIVLTSSILAMMGFVGYSSYSPGKYAIRGSSSPSPIEQD